MNFIDSCLNGDVLMDEIDDYIEHWSNGEVGKNMELHDFLGMSWEEYSIWGTKPSILSVILRSRKHNVSLDEELNIERVALAARAGSIEEAEKITTWLKRIGKI